MIFVFLFLTYFTLYDNSMWAVNFQMFKLDLEKAEEPEIKYVFHVNGKIRILRVIQSFSYLNWYLNIVSISGSWSCC